MLDSSQGASLAVVDMFSPQTITATGVSPTGWVDMTQFEGYVLFVAMLGVLTGSAGVQIQLESSTVAAGTSPVSGGTGAQFPAVAAANTAGAQSLLLPATFFANRYVGASLVVTGTGNVPVTVMAIGGLRSP
jgi:hypothetical protein